MEIHPLAAICPEMTAEEYACLLESIRAIGLQEDITTFQGAILDGRHRDRACAELHVVPRYKALPEGTDPVAFVKAKNLDRRMLSESQRAMVAAKIGNIKRGGTGANQYRRAEDEISPSAKPANPLPGRNEAAALFRVSRDNVTRCKQILELGDPKVAHAVDAGKLKVYSAHKIALLPKDEQPAALEKALGEVGPSGRRQRQKRPQADVPPPVGDPVSVALAQADKLGLVELLDRLREGKRLLESAARKAALGPEVELHRAARAARDAYLALENCIPYAPCRPCGREVKPYCRACCGRGWVCRSVDLVLASSEEEEKSDADA